MKRYHLFPEFLRAAMLLLVCGILNVSAPVAWAEEPHTDEHGDEYDDGHDDGHVALTAAEIQEFGIVVAEAGSGLVQMIRKLPAEVRVNANRLAHIVPRYSGIATEVRVDVGDAVHEGQVLAIVESDGSLAPYEMTAFLAGTVIEKHMTRGEPVSRERDGFLIADLSTVWIDITVYQRDLERVGVGKDVTIRTQSGAAAITGKISYLTPVVDEHTRTATARLVVDNAAGKWRPGMFVMADVLTESAHAKVVVPVSAVHTMDAETVIFVESAEGFTPAHVVVGRHGIGNLEIISGLAPGQHYVAEGGFTIKAELGKGSFGDGHGH